MDDLTKLLPVIEAHAQELKQPGVLAIRPGYRVENDWVTRDPAIVVILAKGAPTPNLPAAIDGTPVDVRQATPVEGLRYTDPERFATLAAQHAEMRSGAFPEVDPDGSGGAVASPPTAQARVAGEGGAAAPDILAKKPQIPYKPPAKASLQSVEGRLTVTCHASPDAGWPTLHAFLRGTQERLTVGLYDFTAKHILEGVEEALAGPQKFVLTLDNPARNPTADQTDSETLDALRKALGNSFASAWALVRSNKAVPRWIYPTAYHIKVAVRDGAAVWLSSGNWNNSNQPDFDPIGAPRPNDQEIARQSDRDWHVVIENAELAQAYEAYLTHDFQVASSEAAGAGARPLAAGPGEFVPGDFAPAAKGKFRFFEPLRLEDEPLKITPLLTPDPGVYRDAMLALLKRAKKKLYIQLQYIHPSDADEDQAFEELVDVVAAKTGNSGIDVRIITSQWQVSNGWLERLQQAGVDLDTVKIQNGVHNKGFVIDGAIVALGSQNWSGDGVLRNRDASVIIESAKAAGYYENIFLHDWDNIARKTVSP